jgi:hypothetical protein
MAPHTAFDAAIFSSKIDIVTITHNTTYKETTNFFVTNSFMNDLTLISKREFNWTAIRSLNATYAVTGPTLSFSLSYSSKRADTMLCTLNRCHSTSARAMNTCIRRCNKT